MKNGFIVGITFWILFSTLIYLKPIIFYIYLCKVYLLLVYKHFNVLPFNTFLKEAACNTFTNYRPVQFQLQRWQPLGLNTHYCSSLEESSYSVLTCGDREGIPHCVIQFTFKSYFCILWYYSNSTVLRKIIFLTYVHSEDIQ